MKRYVLQTRAHSWDTSWITLGLGFDTLEEAKTALELRTPKSLYRIAEAYTVIRYKAVKL